MTQSTAITPPAPDGRLAVALPAEAALLVQRLNALCETAQRTVDAIQANIFEGLYELNLALDQDERRFRRAVEDYLPWLNAEKAVRILRIWESARRNATVADMGRKRPQAVMQLLSDLAEGDQTIDLSEHDEEVGRLLSLPANRRNRELRRLLAQDRDVQAGHHPADRERIRALEAERDDALKALEAARGVVSVPRRRYVEWARETDEMLDRLREYVGRSQMTLKALSGADEVLQKEVFERLLSLSAETESACQTLVRQWDNDNGGMT